MVELKGDDPKALRAALAYLYGRTNYDDGKEQDGTFQLEVAKVADKYLLRELCDLAVEKLRAIVEGVYDKKQAVWDLVCKLHTDEYAHSVELQSLARILVRNHAPLLMEIEEFRDLPMGHDLLKELVRTFVVGPDVQHVYECDACKRRCLYKKPPSPAMPKYCAYGCKDQVVTYWGTALLQKDV